MSVKVSLQQQELSLEITLLLHECE